MQRTDSGFIFRTQWGLDPVDLKLWRIGDDLVPTFFGTDPETTANWMDFRLAEKIREWGSQLVDYNLIFAGTVITAADLSEAAQ